VMRTARIFTMCMLPWLAAAAYAQSTGPFDRYLAANKTGVVDARVSAFAHTCIDSPAKPKKIYLYTEQNSWLTTPSIHSAFASYDVGDANSAEVWFYGGHPRVVYLWEVDLEYERDTLFCMDEKGEVTRAVSRFFPSASGEPREHWIYVHTVKPSLRVNQWESMGVYQDARGNRLGKPEVSTEDHDFIAGERTYRYFHDFDFASEVPTPSTKVEAEK
jgi:hypothetical protein